MSRVGRFAASILISAALIYVAFQNIDWPQVVDQLKAIPLPYILIFAFIQVVMFACRVWRWALLVNPFAPLPISDHIRITAIGVACIVAFPLRLGEFARPILVSQESGKPISSGLGAVAVERTLDGLLVTFLFFAATWALPTTVSIPPTVHQGAILSLLIFSTALMGLVFFLRWEELSLKILNSTLGKVVPTLAQKIQDLLVAFTLGLKALPNPGTLLQVVVSSLIFWVSQGVGVHFLMIGLGWTFPPGASLIVISVLVLAVMIPAGPAFLGTYQAGLLLGLSIFNASPSDAMALGLVMYPIAIGSTLVFSIPFILNARFSLKSLLTPEAP